MLSVCTVIFAAVTLWNLVMMIIFLAARKIGGERYEKARGRFILSSVFFIVSIVLYAAALTLIGIFVEPIFYM